MLANFLGKSKPINFIILLGVFLCVFLRSTYTLFVDTPFEFFFLFKIIGFLALYLFIFFFYNFVVGKNNLTKDNSYAFLIFTILIGHFLALSNDFKTLIFFILYVIFLRKIYSLKSKKNTLQKLFDCGFWLSILFIIEPFSAIFVVLIYAGIFLHQKSVSNTLIAPIVGFLTPLIICFTYCLWVDKLYIFTNLFYFDTIFSFSFNSENTYHWILVLILTLSTTAIFLKSPKAFSVNNSFRKSWILLIINLLVALLFAFFIPIKNDTEFLLSLFPAAIIIANGIESVRSNLIKNIVFVLFLASVVLLPFML